MRQFYQFTLAILITIAINSAHANLLFESDSISLGAGYTKDVYYSFENGEISSAERTNWEIAFYTSAFSAGIITNDGNSVDLYVYQNGDTTDWNSIDTSGLSNWSILYNSIDEWEDGAFNRNALGHPDYGWGKYIQAGTHPIIGDSLFIIRFMDGLDTLYKKLWIERKVSTENTYYFKYADLNGSNEVNEVINCNEYGDKNFVYYSMQTEEILDREPDRDAWDILFTKYNTELAPGVNYIVTGILNNIDVPVNKFEQVAPDFEEWTAAPMDSTKTPIGYNWKALDGFTYVIVDSLAYFVRNKDKHVYKLVFTGFDGSSTGNVYFNKSMVYASAVDEIKNTPSFDIYPNPASDFVTIDLSVAIEWEKLTISDMNGRVLYAYGINQRNVFTVPLDRLNPGVYLITVKSGSKVALEKLIIQR